MSLLTIIFALLLPSLTAEISCGDNVRNRPVKLNGTVIAPGNDLVGIVIDSKTGKGIEGVPVTDGYKYVRTDRRGVYQMKADSLCRNVYYSLPSAYKTAMAEDDVPVFYSTEPIVKGMLNRNDFVLEPKTTDEEKWTLIGISDPQAGSHDDLRRYTTETIPDIISTISAANAGGRWLSPYAVTLGDIVFNTPELWQSERAAHAGIRMSDGRVMPVYQTIGNHDHDGGHTDYEGTQNYVDTFGPTDYSFNIGKAHILCFDDIWFNDVTDRGSYVCGITDRQYEWMKQDLDMVEDKANTLLIVCVHAPFGDAPGVQDYVHRSMHYEDMLKLFSEFHDAHIVSGHTHYAMNYVHTDYPCRSGNPVYDHNEAAACGLIGRPDCDVCVDGAPMGYYIYEIEGNEIVNWHLKATAHPLDYQMRVYDGNQIWQGNDGLQYSWYDSDITPFYAKAQLQNSLVVTLWNGDFHNWKLELFVKGKKYGDLEPVPGETGDIVAYAFKYGDTWGTDILRHCQHYWYIKLPPEVLEDWEVVATQTVPSSKNLKNVYRCSTLQTDFSGFILERPSDPR